MRRVQELDRRVRVVTDEGVVLSVERLESLCEDFLDGQEGGVSSDGEEGGAKRNGGRTGVSSERRVSGSPVMSSFPATLGGLKDF